MTKIAVCVDGSSPSAKAWQWALDFLLKPTDKVVLVAVAPMVNFAAASMEPVGVSPMAVQALLNSNKEQTAALEVAVKKLGKQAKQEVDWVLLRPQHGIGQDLVEHILKEKYDHVVIGNRGLGAMSRTMLSMVGLGSVSDYVLHHAHCPVTVVKTNEKTVE
jgi:nucleotide-binding universal stress UspA family protein